MEPNITTLVLPGKDVRTDPSRFTRVRPLSQHPDLVAH